MNAGSLHDELAALFNEIAGVFGAGDLAKYRLHFRLPIMMVTPGGQQLLQDDAAFDAVFVPMMQRLKALGFARTAFERLSVKPMAPGLVLAAMQWTRYRADGTALETFGATYLLLHRDGRWQIVVLTLHGTDGVAALG
jgi:hypothetical protein